MKINTRIHRRPVGISRSTWFRHLRLWLGRKQARRVWP